jgi:flagellar biosynthesis anti-sigma factor FlgM
MGISKIGSLFAANVDAVPAVTQPKEVTPSSAPVVTPQVSTDAVVLSKNLQTINRTPLPDTESARAAKVKDLKEQVRSGEYKPDSAKVAEAVIRDLA